MRTDADTGQGTDFLRITRAGGASFPARQYSVRLCRQLLPVHRILGRLVGCTGLSDVDRLGGRGGNPVDIPDGLHGFAVFSTG